MGLVHIVSRTAGMLLKYFIIHRHKFFITNLLIITCFSLIFYFFHYSIYDLLNYMQYYENLKFEFKNYRLYVYLFKIDNYFFIYLYYE